MITEALPFPHAQMPVGINHLVLCVRNIHESHAFWTESLGFKHVGPKTSKSDGRPHQQTRFYSGRRNGRLSHHDVALVQDLSAAPWAREQRYLDHIAIAYASEAAWLRQIEYLRSRNISIFQHVRRGTTLSAHVEDPNGYAIELVCELPRAQWESDINAALNKSPVPFEYVDPTNA